MSNIFNIDYLKKQFVSAFAALFVLIISFSGFEYYFFRNQSELASLINLSGRQRMLSQRTAFYATRVVQRKDSESLKELREMTNLFNNSYQSIISGDKKLHLPNHDFKKANFLYFNQGLDRRIKQYVTQLKKIIDNFEKNPKKAKNALSYINSEVDSILVLLNEAVNIYENEAVEDQKFFNRLKAIGTGKF